MSEPLQNRTDRSMSWVVVWSRVGRTLVRGTCPFCQTSVEGYLWSISGSGKRCPDCRALLGSFLAFPPEAKTGKGRS